MNAKIILYFGFIITLANNITASNDDSENCSCWEVLVSCFIDTKDHANYDDNHVHNYHHLLNQDQHEKSMQNPLRCALKNVPAVKESKLASGQQFDKNTSLISCKNNDDTFDYEAFIKSDQNEGSNEFDRKKKLRAGVIQQSKQDDTREFPRLFPQITFDQ